jgi:hypothetical protein
MRAPTIIAALAIMLGGSAFSLAQPNVQGAVELRGGTKVPQNPSLPKLNLTNMQREQIRKAVLTEHNEVEFRLKATKLAKDFNPVWRDDSKGSQGAIAANGGSIANAGTA